MKPAALIMQHIRAVVFDLDNTLVSSELDFKAMRLELGCPSNEDLLTYIESQACQKTKQGMHDVVLRYEIDDARHSAAMQGCHRLLTTLAHYKFKTGIVTRNCRQATETKLSHHNITVDEVLTRECSPAKPDPAALHTLANKWSLKPEQILYVGDYLYDLQAAYNANMPSCLVTHGTTPSFASQASLCVNELHDLHQQFTQTFALPE